MEIEIQDRKTVVQDKQKQVYVAIMGLWKTEK